MSVFYQSLSYWKNMQFKKRKKAFKKGKPCAVCGKTLPQEQMMVAHIIPVRQLSEEDALYDTANWEVRCIPCEHRLNREEALRKNHLTKKAKEITAAVAPVIPHYELDLYLEYDNAIQMMWNKATTNLKQGKKYRRSLYWQRLTSVVKKADRLTLAKAAARFVLCNNGRMPTLDEVYEQMTKDVETKMLNETEGKFRKEKGEKGK